ncbi:hypothetical protein sch_05815 [Serratia plymuthica]|nr:hypothetical protein sch_05815 [Serratia plymuthica]
MHLLTFDYRSRAFHQVDILSLLIIFTHLKKINIQEKTAPMQMIYLMLFSITQVPRADFI